MSKNPILNALAASVYIAFVSSLMYFGKDLAPDGDTVLAPIAILSLFTLSAAMMGFIFLFQPLRFYLDGEKHAAVKLFLTTIAVFAFITVSLFAVMLSGVFL